MNLFIIILMFATLAAVLIGLGVMWKGGELNRHCATKLMSLRVALQALVIGLLFMGALLTK